MKKHTFLTIIATMFLAFCASAQESDTSLLKLSDAKDMPNGSTIDNSAAKRTTPALHALPNSKQTSNVHLPTEVVALPRKGAVVIGHKK